MFTSFSVLLTAFSALLATPGFTTNQAVQQQALALIPQIETIGAEVQANIDALATPVQPTSPVLGAASPQPTTTQPVAQVTVEPVNPSCSVQVSPDEANPNAATVSWESSNTIQSTGQLTFGQYIGCGESCSNYVMKTPIHGTVQGTSGSQYVIFNTNFDYPNNSLNHDNNTKVELNIGGATCDDYVPAK